MYIQSLKKKSCIRSNLTSYVLSGTLELQCTALAADMTVYHGIKHVFLHEFHISTFALSPLRVLVIMNSQNHQLPVGLIAQLVEHCTSIAEVMGLYPVQA